MSTTDINNIPREFDIPQHARESQVAELTREARPRLRNVNVRPAAFAAAAATLVLTAAVATAAATGLFDRDVTRPDIDARATTTTRTERDCASGEACSPGRAETVRETRVLPGDGVTFVAPDGALFIITPATGTIQYDSTSAFARELNRSAREGKELITLSLPGGGTRTISFAAGEGRVEITDTSAEGSRTRSFLGSGEVVPLVPGTLADQALTPDKAVTFDLDNGMAQAWVYPGRNAAYVGSPPWMTAEPQPTDTLAAELVARYQLTRSESGEYGVPVSASGGRWVYETASGATRTVTWNRGDRAVTVTDRDAAGRVLGEEVVGIGRRVDAS